MLKFTIKIVSLALIVGFCTINFLDPFFVEQKQAYFSNQLYKETREPINIGFFGSSHMVNGVDPRLIELNTLVNTFNFGFDGQRIVSTQARAVEVLNKYQLNLAVIDIFFNNIEEITLDDETIKDFQYNTLDYVNFSFDKIKAHISIHGIGELLEISPTIRRHAAWPEIFTREYFRLYQGTDAYAGFFANFSFDPKIYNESVKRRTFHGEELGISEPKPIAPSEKAKKGLLELIEKFKKSKVPVLFISLPHNLSMQHPDIQGKHLGLMNFMDEQGAEVLDFNGVWETQNLQAEDYLNISHLNASGAKKVSDTIGKYIKHRFSLAPSDGIADRLKRNRYEIIEGTIPPGFIKEFSEEEYDSHGIKKLYAYHSTKDRFEIILEGDTRVLEEYFIQFDFVYPDYEENKMDLYTTRRMHENKLYLDRMRAINNMYLDGRHFKVIPFHVVFSHGKNANIYWIHGDQKVLLATIPEFELN